MSFIVIVRSTEEDDVHYAAKFRLSRVAGTSRVGLEDAGETDPPVKCWRGEGFEGMHVAWRFECGLAHGLPKGEGWAPKCFDDIDMNEQVAETLAGV
jgi:hypothetical protein